MKGDDACGFGLLIEDKSPVIPKVIKNFMTDGERLNKKNRVWSPRAFFLSGQFIGSMVII
jgi:hypothetical protein